MKRFTVAVLLLIAVAAFAAERKLEFFKLPAGESRTFEFDGKKVTARQTKDLTYVTIVEPDGTKSEYQIPPRKRVVVGGIAIDTFQNPPLIQPAPRPDSRWGTTATWTFVCPKDEALLQVKQNPGGKTYRCPVDGQMMVQGRGPGGMYFYVE